MLEDPRTQRMKQMKIELLKNFVICILIALVIYFVSVGLPLFGMPKLDDVVSAQATYDGQTVEIAQEDMQIAVDLAGGLHIWPGTVETGLTRAYITYQMADGSQMVVGADAQKVYRDGECYPVKGDNGGLFETVVADFSSVSSRRRNRPQNKKNKGKG